MKRPWQIWTIFTVALAVVLCALGWMTAQAVRLEQVERERDRQDTIALRKNARDEKIALRQSESEANVGPALWLMDSLLAAELAQQSAWPPLAYRAVYREGSALGSPLLLARSPYTLLHFEIAADGQVTSPQVPPPAMWPHARLLGVSTVRLEASKRRLDDMRLWADHDRLLAALPHEMISLRDSVALNEPAPSPAPSLGNVTALPTNSPIKPSGIPANPFDQQTDLLANQQRRDARGRKGLESRRRVNGEFVKNSTRQQRFVQGQYQPQSQSQFSAQAASPQAPQQQSTAPSLPQQLAATDDPGVNALAPPGITPGNFARINSAVDSVTLASIREGIGKPLWIGESLVYARRVEIGGKQYVQGCLLNWPAIEMRLLAEIADRLPDAKLERMDGDPGDGRALAMLPVKLVVPQIVVPPIVEPPLATASIPVEIIIAWGGVLLAAIAVAGLLLGVMTLSERRAAFVSAVTHELRTPLTTFRMYAEMLAEGMVPDEADRQHYLRTLQNEADRLTHLVENVLSYARVERGRPGGRVNDFHVLPLLKRIANRLDDQVSRAAMQLVVDDADASNDILAHADAAAVEQIVVNLIDNAAKYAAGGDDGRIHLQATIDTGTVEITVRDHGPGIDRKEARRLFRPFCKSAKDAAHSAPGVGLGLALSRRLASAMGGSLRLDESDSDGACFVLRLPTGSA